MEVIHCEHNEVTYILDFMMKGNIEISCDVFSDDPDSSYDIWVMCKECKEKYETQDEDTK